MNDMTYSTARAVGSLSVLAVLSPLAGMAVEIALAWRFGTSPAVDAFRIGMVFLLMGQQLLVLQILPHIVVPVFTDYEAQAGKREAWRVVLSLGNVFLSVVVAFAVLVFVWPDALVWVFASGLTGEAHQSAAIFLRWFALAYVPLVWSGLAAGVLYVHGIFWLPPFSQLLANSVLAAVILALSGMRAVTALLIGVLLSTLLGASLYTIKLLPLMRQAGAGVSWRLNFGHPGVRRGLALALSLLGTFVLGQWAPVAVNRAISRMPQGNLAMFGYAFKMGLIVSLVPLSLATVLFPKFAQRHFSMNREAFRVLCTRAVRMAFFLALPLAACCFALRRPLAALLYERGAFSPNAAESVAGLFGLLVLGAPAAVSAVFLEKILYALEQAWLPTGVRFGGIALLTALIPFAATWQGVNGLALLLSFVGWCSAVALFFVLYRQHRAFALMDVIPFFGQMILLGSLCAWLGSELGRWLGQATAIPVVSRTVSSGAGFSAGLGLFFFGAAALRVPEALACSRYLRWQSNAVVRWVQSAVRS